MDLKWQSKGAATYELQERYSEQREEHGLSQTRYTGPDSSSVRSGLQEGWHAFQVRAIEKDGTRSEWSETLYLKVTYMDRGRLQLLLLLGGLVVLSTIAAILHGHLSHRNRKEANG